MDINVFIDIIEKRQNWEDSLAAIDALERKHEGFVSALTKVILYFRRARITSGKNARKEVNDILEHFKLVSMDHSMLDAAFSDENFDDVEDAIQFHSAIKVANIIITRNK